MRQNTDALWTELRDALDTWNSTTENEEGNNVLTDDEVNGYAHALHSHMMNDMFEMGQLV